jgi:hypothetical protein
MEAAYTTETSILPTATQCRYLPWKFRQHVFPKYQQHYQYPNGAEIKPEDWGIIYLRNVSNIKTSATLPLSTWCKG